MRRGNRVNLQMAAVVSAPPNGRSDIRPAFPREERPRTRLQGRKRQPEKDKITVLFFSRSFGKRHNEE
ncbi:hypothetical protein SKAU_G00368040 [Synaphobranchus kaupii]|uniref:Uncharacterized protein n=1 Tax=Synaphobranchus kaupii TaxID=118154 RepID=A0A9Q1EFG7_SYNKA|nr:hypothetical protein SKAU_G00368040 [Synaphobranchus kaupii]